MAVRTKDTRVKGSNSSQLGDDDSKEARVSDLGERERKKEFFETKEPRYFFQIKNKFDRLMDFPNWLECFV